MLYYLSILALALVSWCVSRITTSGTLYIIAVVCHQQQRNPRRHLHLRPYGNTTTSGTEATANPFRFQGGYQDTTGYYTFGTRYYNPAIYGWTQPDPKAGSIDNPTSLLRYDLDGNDPINGSDSSGASVGGDVEDAAKGCVTSAATTTAIAATAALAGAEPVAAGDVGLSCAVGIASSVLSDVGLGDVGDTLDDVDVGHSITSAIADIF